MSLTTLAGFKHAAQTTRTQIMDSWFNGSAACPIRVPVIAQAAAIAVAAPTGKATAPFTKPVEAERTPDGSFSIVTSLRQITAVGACAPAMPTAPVVHPIDPAPFSPYERMDYTLSPLSNSSQFLAEHGILDKFTAEEAVMDMALSPEGFLSASIRSQDGYRRTVICRPNGTIAQRVTSPDGKELVRFASDGKAADLKI
jgi:hypothetical protein